MSRRREIACYHVDAEESRGLHCRSPLELIKRKSEVHRVATTAWEGGVSILWSTKNENLNKVRVPYRGNY